METLDLLQLEVIFYVLLGLIGLILISLIVYVVLANRRERDRLMQAYEADRLSPRSATKVTGQILALFREVPGAPLQVEIDGERYSRLSEIQDPRLKRQVVESAMELIQFTGVLGAEVDGPAPEEKTYSWREDLREESRSELQRIHGPEVQPAPRPTSPSSASLPSTPETVEERFLDLLSEMGQASTGVERPTLASALQQRWSSTTGESDQPQSFVDEIEKIVQRRIQLIPALSRRELHVRPSPEGTVSFVFEGQKYNSVDEIPNLTARQVIRDSIQEWDDMT
ncbi:MAG: hypothetical protein PVF47_06905 [Anaerolineae bacterium]|jgi:hypothetical protein